MSLNKCSHGCYSPDGSGFSYACSGCTTPDPAIKIRPLKKETEGDEEPIIACPMCLSEEFVYISEEEFRCPQCGYDETTI